MKWNRNGAFGLDCTVGNVTVMSVCGCMPRMDRSMSSRQWAGVQNLIRRVNREIGREPLPPCFCVRRP